MLFYKTSQPVPGKGDAWMYYECNDDQSIRRYLTYIPATRETNKVPKPFIKKLQRPEMLMPSTQDEFLRYWGEEGNDAPAAPAEVVAKDGGKKTDSDGKHFDPDMTVGEAMAVHPRVAEVFAAFHLGGCSTCGVGAFETVGQVCMGYGVDSEILLDVLEGLMEGETSEADESAAAVE